jgi:hypothetical protein
MTPNQIKNFSISIFGVFIIGYSLIVNFSLVGLAGALSAIGAVFLIALVYRKEQGVIEKIDIYILLTFLGILVINYEELSDAFTVSLFTSGFDRNPPVQLIALTAGTVIGLILSSNAKKTNSLAVKTILKYTGLFLIVLGVSIFCWAAIYVTGLAQQVLIFGTFGLIALCRANRTTNAGAIGRLSFIALLLATLTLALSVFFPDYSLSQYSINAFLSVTVFPWYTVLGITLLLLSIVGIGLHYGEKIDEDTIFITGLVGFTWVVKAAVYFYFDFSFIAICVYTLLFFGYTNRSLKRINRGKKTSGYNEYCWLLIAAASVVVSIFLIYTGYIYFWLALTVGFLTVRFLPANAPGWARDAVFWTAVLFSVAGAACAVAIQNGYSEKKILTIAALFVFAGIAMWMMNHRNTIGRNKYKATKTAMAVVFALLVIIPAFKAGVNINVDFEDKAVSVGALVRDESPLVITATADGKSNAVKKLYYVWADSFFFDKDDIAQAVGTDVRLSVSNNHLVIWAEDEYGVVTRKDIWYYDAAREGYPSGDIYKIGD